MLTQDELRNLFDYRNNNLYWKERPFRSRVDITKPAGYIDSAGYRIIRTGGINYGAHRFVYQWHYGNLDKSLVIDHIDRNRSNNNIENIRQVTYQQNCFNCSNVKGYCWDKAMGKWKAYIRIDGVKTHLGYFDIEAKAQAAYEKAKAIYHIIPSR